MARTVQRLAIVFAISATIIGYLYRLPNSEGIAQLNRVRALSSSMKIIHFIGTVSKIVGVSNHVGIIRKFTNVMKKLRPQEEDAGLRIEDTTIGNVPVRIARPVEGDRIRPVIVYFHGGAFYMGSVESHNALTSTLARSADVVVISVEYRLAPENPFPAAVEDCYTVVKYVLEHGDKLNVDRRRVALAGDSAGGNLAAVISMRFATHPVGKHSPRLQILIYPVLQYADMMLPSYMQQHVQIFYYSVDQLLTYYLNEKIDQSVFANNHTSVEQKKHIRKYIDWSLIPSKYRTIYKKPITDEIEGDPDLIARAREILNPEISPLLVENNQLAKLPSTYVLSVGHDRLRDEAFIYAARVKRAGVQVVHKHYENTFHGALGFLYGPFGLDIAHEMLSDIVKYVKENL